MRAVLLPIVTKATLALLVLAGLCGCASSPIDTHPPPPKNVENICAIFKEYPAWYQDALNSYYRWHVPVSVQMAIVKHESDFQAGAAPPKKKLFGFIPSTARITSAYGYAQALNDTWRDYQRETKKRDGNRDQMRASLDFIGWYSNKAHQKAGVKLNNAYDLYLAYHEGIAGYINGTYQQKPDIIRVAGSVKRLAALYKKQLHQCKYRLATS